MPSDDELQILTRGLPEGDLFSMAPTNDRIGSMKWSLRILFTGLVMAVALTLVSAYRAWPLRPLSMADISARAREIRQSLLAQTHGVETLNFTPSQIHTELYRPETLFPSDFGQPKEMVLFDELKQDCKTIAIGAARNWAAEPFKKYFRLQNAACTGQPFDPNLLKSAPWISPSGVSFVYELASKMSAGNQQAFLNLYKNALHVLERSNEELISQLSLTELRLFNRGAHVFLTPKSVWVLRAATSVQITYGVYPRAVWNALEKQHGLVASNFTGGECLFEDGTLCFNEDPRIRFWNTVLWASFAAVLVLLLLILACLLIQRRHLLKRYQADRELVMQTLAHELRHPVTSLRLSLEVFREEFDKLSELTQDEFLRMCDQVSRLVRLTETSKQYIQSSSKSEQVFNFNFENVPSMNDFMEDSLRNYMDRISWTPLDKDCSAKIDVYWLSLCVHNLVKNALIHGAKPVAVSLHQSESGMEIRVTDAGTALAKDFQSLLTPRSKSSGNGLGLGLSLVNRLARHMGAELIYSATPKYFAIRWKGSHER